MALVVKSAPQILPAIVGTAGHVDHGKTSLVKLLTGCETDRLPEEKARGMSIDLGFAPCLLTGRRVVGIVDVPGHKDFIRNMVAGASSIDVLLLVIAADDGVMPQTDEHMRLVRLLRTPQVMVALTKLDMVSADMLELAKQDIAAFLARHGYPDAPVVPVSNKTGEGIGEVRDAIEALVDRVRQRQPDGRAFRMNVERVFSVKGYGTVATGIPMSGRAQIGEAVELLPAGVGLTVRTVQCYKQESDAAPANCCCAINVRDIEPSAVARGMTIASPGVYRATREMLVRLENVSEQLMLKRRFEAVLHTGTAAVGASVKLLEETLLAPGEEAFAHVALEEPLVAAAGDRFVLRQPSPAATVAGGMVLSVRPQRIRRHAEVHARLERAYEHAQKGDLLMCELLAGPDAIVTGAEAQRLAQCDSASARAAIGDAVARGELTSLGGDYLVTSRAEEVAARLTAILARYHQQNPYAWGMTASHVCEALALEPRAFGEVARALAGRGFAVKHGRLALDSFKPPISEKLLGQRDTVMKAIEAAGVLGVARGDLMREHGISEADMKIVSKLLIGERAAAMLDGNLILQRIVDESREKLLALFAGREQVELAAFRDAIGSTRKMAVALLDGFDAEGITRRVGDHRVLRKAVV